jgi:hypothetical protein
MADTRTWVSVTVKLDCGCEIAHTMASTNGPDKLDTILRMAGDALPHHFDRSFLVHKCELVSESNPNGNSQLKDN